MTASLQATALLAADPLFQARVQAAMVTAAVNVAAEAVGAMDIATYQLRHNLAAANLQGSRLPSGAGGMTGVPWVSQFAWAVASNVSISGDVGPLVPVESTTGAFPAEIATAVAHGLADGQWVTIAGHQVNDAVNGTWAVTVTGSATFTIPVPGTIAGGATGTVQLQPPDSDIQFAVNSVFGSVAGAGTAT
jgi:hypothetical protein